MQTFPVFSGARSRTSSDEIKSDLGRNVSNRCSGRHSGEKPAVADAMHAPVTAEDCVTYAVATCRICAAACCRANRWDGHRRWAWIRKRR